MKTGEKRTVYLNEVCPGEEYRFHGPGFPDVCNWTVIVDMETGIAFTAPNVIDDGRIPRILVADLLDAGFKP